MKKIIVAAVIALVAVLAAGGLMIVQKFREQSLVTETQYSVGNTKVIYQERLLKNNMTGDMFEAEDALKAKGWEDIVSAEKVPDTIFAKSTSLQREECISKTKDDMTCPFTPKDTPIEPFSSYYRDGDTLISILPTENLVGEKGIQLNVYENEKKITELIGFTDVADGYVSDVRKYEDNYVVTYSAWDEATKKSPIKAYYFDEKKRLMLGDHEPRGTFLYKNKVGYISAETDQIYFDGSPVSPKFDLIRLYTCCAGTPMPYVFNEKNGTLDFVMKRDDKLYLAHIDFIDQ